MGLFPCRSTFRTLHDHYHFGVKSMDGPIINEESVTGSATGSLRYSNMGRAYSHYQILLI
jgi:hypothetical protein